MERFLPMIDHAPHPSLLHGDLWAAISALASEGTADLRPGDLFPATAKPDLAMTELFGGFPPDFYAAYHATWLLDSGYRVRRSCTTFTTCSTI